MFQFLTAPFLHAGVIHLAFNMLTLAFLGPPIEAILGRCRYVVFSTLCAASAMVGFLAWGWGTATAGGGYSGVIFGLLVAHALIFPDAVIYIFAFFPLKMKHAALILGAVELYFTVSGGDGETSHVAHLGGALAGFLYLKLAPWQRATSPTRLSASRPPERKVPPRDDIPFEL